MNIKERFERVALTGLTLAGLGTACGKPPEVKTPSAEPTPTVRPRPTDIPPTPTIVFETPTPEPTPTIELAPTPTAVIEMGVSEMAIGGEETDILSSFDKIVRGEVNKEAFETSNPGLKLLVAEGAAAQAFVQFQKNGQTLALGNSNLPVFKEGQVKFPPVFNTPDFGFLMGWVDNEGNWLYHIPLQPGVEGKAPVVYQKGDTLYEGLVDLQTGKIDPATEKAYWQEMPQEAVKAVMAKYQNAVYVTFWDKDGKQLENERIKVCDLPPEPTPTPEARPLDLPGLNEVWNSQNGRWEYVDVDKQVVAYWDASANGGKGRVELASGMKALDFEKHKGLFVGWDAQQAEAATRKRWEEGKTLAFALPFDPNSSSGLVEINASLKIHLCFRSLQEGTGLNAPFSGNVEKYGSTNGKGFLIILNKDIALDLAFPKGADFGAVGDFVRVGQQLLKLSRETLPPYFAGFGESYQFVIVGVKPDFSLGYDTTLSNLLRDEKGCLVYIK